MHLAILNFFIQWELTITISAVQLAAWFQSVKDRRAKKKLRQLSFNRQVSIMKLRQQPIDLSDVSDKCLGVCGSDNDG